MKKLAIVLAALPAAACGFGSTSVVRVVDGRPIEGRFIDTATYALYARGAYHEQHGELAHARAAYAAAAERDPKSAAIWTRLGAVQCAGKDPGYERSFAVAANEDPTYAPLWRERATCALGRGKPRRAVEAAETAVLLEPEDEQNSLVLARALDRDGRTDDALRWLHALTVARPRAVAAWTLLQAIAKRRGRDAERLRAAQALAELSATDPTRAAGEPHPSPAPESELDALDRALGAGELTRARRLAVTAGVRADRLAVRAAALGSAGAAGEQAELVLAADPTNGNAWVAALVAADLDGDPERFRRALDALAREALPPEPLAARLMAALLARRVGADAARAWLEAYGELPPPSDALERRVAARLGPS